ncbi:MAG: NAD(P)/FAD-dependent oxidoreductase [Candidatus Lernaella stagnicola]|nr:NAD(P)/FAD-dependent oxidoreductase [Candidatus Lernaella stagnicola]
MSISQYDVIVVGAGPTGSTAAFETAKAGYRVLLLERDAYPGENNSCGGGLGQFLQPKFDLPDSLIHKKINAVRLDLGFREKTYQAPSPIYMSIKRTEFDRFLADRAVQAGAELRVRQNAVAYDPFHKVLTILDRETKTNWEATAHVVIFADGVRTLARTQCGVGVDATRDPIVALAWELSYPDNPYDAFEFIFDERKLSHGYYWVFPTTDTLNVGFGGPARHIGRNARQWLQGFIDSRPDLKGLKPVRKTAGLIPSHVAERFHGAGILVVGDAAGFVNPLTGGGIYIGMLSAQMAARTVCEALAVGRFDNAFLSRYTRRIKTSPIYYGLHIFHALVNFTQRYRRRTGKPILGKVFKLYSDIGDFALRRL